MLRMPWIEHVSNKEGLRKGEIKRVIFRIKMRQHFLDYLLRKHGFKNLTLAEPIGGKRDRLRRQVTLQDCVNGIFE